MRIGDDEIGYCLIENPPEYKAQGSQKDASTSANDLSLNNDLLKDLASVLQKYGVISSKNDGEVLNVSQGLLSWDNQGNKK